MFDPILDKVGPLGVALLLAALFCAVLIPVLWDLAARLVPVIPRPELWRELTRARLHVALTLVRERVARAMLGSFVAGG